MKSIVYISKSSVNDSQELFDKLVTNASLKNKSANITGFLSYVDGRFLQCIEGDDKYVSALMEKIKVDARHCILYETSLTSIGHRNFEHCSMKPVTVNDHASFGLRTIFQQTLTFINIHYADRRRCDMYMWQQVKNISLL